MKSVLNWKEKVQEIIPASVPYVPRYLEQFVGVSYRCKLFKVWPAYISCVFEGLQKEIKLRLHK